ncbi:MAG: hypothetical protein LBP29_08680 [Treponema sp.]|jgi:hypothetical protein|nr:hypothetical protein [Treponema sp.]
MEDVLPALEQNDGAGNLRIRALKKKINDKDYLYGAIQRIALVLSNEITGSSRGEKVDERKGR